MAMTYARCLLHHVVISIGRLPHTRSLFYLNKGARNPHALHIFKDSAAALRNYRIEFSLCVHSAAGGDHGLDGLQALACNAEWLADVERRHTNRTLAHL